MPDHFVKVAEVAQIPEGGSKVIYFNRKEVAIFNCRGVFYAVDNLCPHRQAPLSAGRVEGEVVVCHWHGARFDLRTGKGLEGPHPHDIGCYRVKVEDGEVKLAL